MEGLNYKIKILKEADPLWTPENESFFMNLFKGDKIIASF